jgi:hypothetical protein
MEYPITNNIRLEEIENGALILLLLRKCRTWEDLCARFAYADPEQLQTNTTTMMLLHKLFAMREVGLISFQDQQTGELRRPVGDITETDLFSKIRVAFGGMSLREAAMLSSHSNGMAVAPVFGRPSAPDKKTHVFVLMPFKAKLGGLYTNHIKRMGEELGLTIRRADDVFSPRPFVEVVWEGICNADLVLADCTEKNANVFYEIGMAHTVGKTVVLITRSEKDIPSDIKHLNYISYVYDPEGVDDLIQKVRTFLKSHFKL